MKANELRLGNWVYDTEGKPNQINMDALRYLNSYGNTPICQVHPIPLTDEILLKCEFERNGLKYFWKHHGYHLEFDGVDWCVMPFADSEHVITYISYLHQLQNAYFVITQKELTYTP